MFAQPISTNMVKFKDNKNQEKKNSNIDIELL